MGVQRCPKSDCCDRSKDTTMRNWEISLQHFGTVAQVYYQRFCGMMHARQKKKSLFAAQPWCSVSKQWGSKYSNQKEEHFQRHIAIHLLTNQEICFQWRRANALWPRNLYRIPKHRNLLYSLAIINVAIVLHCLRPQRQCGGRAVVKASVHLLMLVLFSLFLYVSDFSHNYFQFRELW